jgi:signal transduction histidine kinase
MARLERLHIVGEMAASIGHEIRNPMTTVRGFLQLLGAKQEYTQDTSYFALMIEELDRANSIITEFLSLAKNKVMNLKMQNLNNIAQAIFPLINADAIHQNVYVHVEYGDIPDLLLDQKEIRQLILNLVRNGIEAMPSGGNLMIKTFREGEEVVLAVEDQGTGIEPDVFEKMGTPFYTTKENGTGLGLAVCYSIAARHNATIKAATGPNGTAFFVQFTPAHD